MFQNATNCVHISKLATFITKINVNAMQCYAGGMHVRYNCTCTYAMVFDSLMGQCL